MRCFFIIITIIIIIIIIIIYLFYYYYFFTSTAVSRVMSVFPRKFQIFEKLGALPSSPHAPAHTPLVLTQ